MFSRVSFHIQINACVYPSPDSVQFQLHRSSGLLQPSKKIDKTSIFADGAAS